MFNKIKEVIKEAEWNPSLDWEKIPDEFSEIAANDIYFEKMMKNINKSE